MWPDRHRCIQRWCKSCTRQASSQRCTSMAERRQDHRCILCHQAHWWYAIGDRHGAPQQGHEAPHLPICPSPRQHHLNWAKAKYLASLDCKGGYWQRALRCARSSWLTLKTQKIKKWTIGTYSNDSTKFMWFILSSNQVVSKQQPKARIWTVF